MANRDIRWDDYKDTAALVVDIEQMVKDMQREVEEVSKVPKSEVKVPLFADARTILAALSKQLEILESLEEDLEGEAADQVRDAIFYLKETLDALKKIK